MPSDDAPSGGAAIPVPPQPSPGLDAARAAAQLSRRLARLERSQRRLRAVVGALLLALGALALLGASDDGVLRGRSVQLRDEQGRVRVLLTAATGLSVLDARGAPRVVLGLDGDGPGLVLSSAGSRAILSLNRDGPALTFTGARGQLQAILAAVRGEPGLVFFDAEQRERLHLAVRGGGAHGELRGPGDTAWRFPAE